MNFTQEFEFTCTETTDGNETQTVKRIVSKGVHYDEIVYLFLDFLSSSYGYPITLERLLYLMNDVEAQEETQGEQF